MNKSSDKEEGFALVTTTVIIAILLLSGISLMNYTVTIRKAGKSVQDEFNAVQLAEAGVQKTIFCLNETVGDNCGGTFGADYVGETGVDLGTGTFTTTLIGTSTIKTVTSVGTTPGGATKTVLAEISAEPDSDGAAFGYALQSGAGGAYLENGASVSGTLYANGDITCQTTGAIIDGDAYVSSSGGMIDDCTVNYDTHADKVIDSVVGGDAYYDTDISGSTVTGAQYPGSATPDTEELPDIDLAFWHQSAEVGGTITGDYAPADESTLGPKKINGDLIINNNIDVTITGPVWVVGDIITGNGCSFTLDSSFGRYSTAILADDPSDQANIGYIDLTNGTSIYGSGDPKSHLMFITTNTSISSTTPALNVANNASGAVFIATAGMLKLANNAGAKSLSAYQLFVSQNATVTYVESALADATFANSPGGVWRLGAGGWRQTD
ncbi:MAG: hypothetical protein U9Q03_02560 [Patescibacteria group bacterium]|nr:hypothetical protein [Patescibacteria group bacterium]